MTQEVLDALQGAAAELPAPETEDGGRAIGAADAETADSAPEDEAAAGAGAAQTALDDGGRRGDIRAHFDALAAQAEQLRAEFPEFDLREALRDPDFVRLTAPGVGVDARRAYYALHREELDARAAQMGARESEKLIARSLASGAQRPREGGGRQGPGSFTADYGAMTRSEQLRFKQRILEASARGEKLYP